MSEQFLTYDGYYYAAVAIDLVLLMAMLFLVRQIFGLTTGLSSLTALTVHDNYAFGVSLAGATVGLTIMLTGVAAGDVAASLTAEALSVIGYGIGGVVLLVVARWLFDRIAFPKLNVKTEIGQANMAAGVLDAGNMIATAIILRGAMAWIEGQWQDTVLALIGAFVISQILLTLASRYRVTLFAQRNKEKTFVEAIQGGNAALALRFAGFQIGVALAASGAGSFALFQSSDPTVLLISLLIWFIGAAVLMVLTIILTMVLERVVLAGVEVAQEVDREGNIGVAALEAAAYGGVGLIILGLLG